MSSKGELQVCLFCHLSGHECNKFEHDLCPRLEKVFLSKFLTCYLSITFKSLPEAAMNKNIQTWTTTSFIDRATITCLLKTWAVISRVGKYTSSCQQIFIQSYLVERPSMWKILNQPLPTKSLQLTAGNGSQLATLLSKNHLYEDHQWSGKQFSKENLKRITSKYAYCS